MVTVLLQFKVGKTNAILSLQGLPWQISKLTRGSVTHTQSKIDQQEVLDMHSQKTALFGFWELLTVWSLISHSRGFNP